MNPENQDATFRDLSVMLEKQLETVIANQRLLLAMHETLKHLLPKYETEVLAALANPQQPKKEQQDANQMWESFAKKTLLSLRQ
jgi:alpha-L-fucosidase